VLIDWLLDELLLLVLLDSEAEDQEELLTLRLLLELEYSSSLRQSR
jgi:hypothetical protein